MPSSDRLPTITSLSLPGRGRIRSAWWRPAQGAVATVVLLGGRCEFIERYQELAEYWLDLGYQAFSFDWRGQGLSDRFVPDQRGHIPDFALLRDDLAWLLAREVAGHQVGPLVLFGHSMGGLLALMALADRLAPVAATILSAPMVAIDTGFWPPGLARVAAGVICRLGFGRHYAFGEGDYRPLTDDALADSLLTHDTGRLQWLRRTLQEQPGLVVGGVTFGWLDAAFRACARVTEPGVPEGIVTPVLVLSAGRDRLVPEASQELLARRLPASVLHRYPQARHEVLNEISPIRNRALADITGFLARHAICGAWPAPHPGPHD